MKYEWIRKTIQKIQSKKPKKTGKHQREIAPCEEKAKTEKASFCSSTVFSLDFKIRLKTIHAAKPLASALHFLFRRHYSNLTSKTMKICEHILQQDSGPTQFKFFEL